MSQAKRKASVNWNIIRRLLGYVAGYWELKAVVILIVLTTAFSVLTPAIIGSIVDMIRGITEGTEVPMGRGVERLTYALLLPVARMVQASRSLGEGYATLLVFSSSLIVFALLNGVLNYFQRYGSTIISQRAGFDLRSDLYDSLLEQSFSFYDQQRTGQIMAKATSDIYMLGRFFNFGFRMALNSALLLFLALYSMSSLNVQLTLVSVLVMPFMSYSTWIYSRRVSPMWRVIREQNGVITSVIQENLSGLRVVRGFRNEEHEMQKFAKECQEYFDLNVKLGWNRAFFWPLASLISGIGLVLIIWYGGNQVISGVLSLGSMIAFYFYMNQLMRPVRMLGMIVSMFVRTSAAAERVFEIIDADIDVKDSEGAQELDGVEGRIVFEDVWFSYDGENMVLRDIDLVVEPGQTVAILGSTGSGKSSIINLIPRFYDVSRGRITLDGGDIRDVTVKSLRRQIGIVRQNPFIFSKTLRENIAYGVDDASLEDIRVAAEQAKIGEFIESQPEGYDTRVGERGVTLSGGQKQRVAIARALLKNPKILILDDSTSSVDTETEHEIQGALEELLTDRTTFIITQRLSSIKKADYIIVLEDGAIAEEGVHEELMALNGIYSRLYRTQVGGRQ